MDGGQSLFLEPAALPASGTLDWAKARAQPDRVAAAAVAALAALCGWSIYKGCVFAFHGDENYFWVNTYAHGLVRRGLAGTLLAPLLHDAGLPRLITVVLAINRATLGLIVMVLLLAIARQTRHGAAASVLAGVFAASPFLGQTAFLVGFPDGLIALMFTALIAAAWRGPALLVLTVAMLAALTHEFVPLVALPGVCLAACLRGDIGVAGRVGMIVSVLAAILAGWLMGHAPPGAIEALARRLAALGETPAGALSGARWRLTQSTHEDTAMVAAIWRWWWLNGLIGIGYACTPALVLCALGSPRLPAALRGSGATWAPAWRRVVLGMTYAASCFSPLFILPVAIDLSRLAGFTALTTLVTVLALPPAPLPRAGRTVAAVTCAVFLLLPVYCLHLPYAYAARLRLLSPVCPACTRAFVDVLTFYNRGQPQAARDEVLSSPAYLNGLP